MRDNVRLYKGYAIKKITVHTVNGSCPSLYHIYKENESGYYKSNEGFIHSTEKLKEAKEWIDSQMN